MNAQVTSLYVVFENNTFEITFTSDRDASGLIYTKLRLTHARKPYGIESDYSGGIKLLMPSLAMVLTVYDKRIFVYNEKKIQLLANPCT